MNYLEWSSHELSRQIKALGFGQYAHEFVKNEICGIHIPLITEEHLIEMGVNRIGHRILLIRRFADIVANNRIPTTAVPRYASPAIEPKIGIAESDNSEDTGKTIVSKRATEMTRSPNKRVVEEAPKPIEKKYTRAVTTTATTATASAAKNPPTDDDDDASSHSSTSHKSARSSRSSSTKSKGNVNQQLGSTEVSNRGSRAANYDQQQDTSNLSQDKDNRIQCKYCGRKFQPDAAKRHIPVCGRINGKTTKK